MAYKVLIPEHVSDAGPQYLRDNGYEVHMGTGHDAETIKNEIHDCHEFLQYKSLG
jgi:hypothetical protein